ncbi:uncharacterized protein TRIADDRAFT_56315 [Trichoplax adhaerens]|uniref:D-serine dehydratase-like domain-containing protein n=1 Tax=Trichoplax adhaerens TaxID=10228 RepID=B3RXS7_TRIAD|nr:hypothetical protein TRIADDRAFT_56315 [Trichoplax adhaerens]EDV24481.1 hypothetical protein TRIADDRAFT_56315 [Trichoplax adhaerens]|eukprot:XP_002112371.1 hypothetical protein TRIADDRAFT_56315 [Trichoplax adhaerens]
MTSYSLRVGCSIRDILTPALVVDLQKLDYNLKRLPESLKGININIRPHAKAHKCPSLAHFQIKHGSVGMCCQKLCEAESMVTGGIKDILLSNELVGKSKLTRLALLARNAHITVCIDNEDVASQLSHIAKDLNVELDALVEIDVGQERCGVPPGEAAVNLARHLTSLPNLHYKGIQAYQGWNQHIRKYNDRKAAVDMVVTKVKVTLEALRKHNLPCEIVTGGGTGTYIFEANSGVYTEVQPGSYVFMDADYGRNFDQKDEYVSDFRQSLFVLSTVVSVTPGQRAVLDAGLKAISLDSGVPVLADYPELTFNNGGDEHGIITPAGNFKVGDTVWLVPGHCDPTVNMYDNLIGIRNGIVECVWPISGRGPGV